MALVHAVAGDNEEQVTGAYRAADREVVREDLQVADHVELPDDVLIDLAVVLLGGERTVVLAVEEAFGVGGDHFGPVGDVVEPVSLDIGRRTDSLERPVVHPTGGELAVSRLPQELAGVGVERHDVAAVAGQRGVALALVVGPHVDAITVQDGAAVGLRTERFFPQHVGAAGGVPSRGEINGVGDHVAVRAATEHGGLLGLENAGRGQHEKKGKKVSEVHLVLTHGYVVEVDRRGRIAGKPGTALPYR